MSQSLVVSPQNAIEHQMAQAEVWAKSSLVPESYRNKPADIVVAVTLGHELGFQPLQSLQLINVISGKPSLGINALMALCRRHGGQYAVITAEENVNKECVVRVTRGQEIWEEKFTMADAQSQGLTGKSNWTKMPRQMLFARALSQAIRRVFADVICGLYSTEEMLDSQPEAAAEKKAKVTPVKAPPTALLDLSPVEEIHEGIVEQPELPISPQPEDVAKIFKQVFGRDPTPEVLVRAKEQIAKDKPTDLVAYFTAKKAVNMTKG